MKYVIQSLIAAMLLFVGVSAFALQEVPIVLSTRTTGTVTGADMYARSASNGPVDNGIIANAKVTSVTGSATLTITIQGKSPQGEYYDLLSLTPVQSAVGTVNTITLRPGITAAAGASASAPLPPVFRVKSSITGTGSATYSIGVSRTN